MPISKSCNALTFYESYVDIIMLVSTSISFIDLIITMRAKYL